MKRFLAHFLLMILLPLPVLAEEKIDLSTPGADALTACPLPDGRIVFAGSAAEEGDFYNKKARLLCLNADGSPDWEYIHPAEGNCLFDFVCVLDDGCIGAVFINQPDQTVKEAAIFRFSSEGKITDGPIDIFTENMFLYDVTDACIVYSVATDDSTSFCYYFVDWKGNPLFSLQEKTVIGNGFQIVPAEDGVILAGKEKGYPAPAKLVKLDFSGNVMWSKTLASSLTGADTFFSPVVCLADGSFVALLREEVLNSASENDLVCEFFLMRFSPDGSVLWKTSASSLGLPGLSMLDAIELGDYLIIAEDTLPGEESFWTYRRFLAADGSPAGAARQPVPEGIRNHNAQFVVLDDGLWVRRDIRQIIINDHSAELNSNDQWLIKMPGF